MKSQDILQTLQNGQPVPEAQTVSNRNGIKNLNEKVFFSLLNKKLKLSAGKRPNGKIFIPVSALRGLKKNTPETNVQNFNLPKRVLKPKAEIKQETNSTLINGLFSITAFRNTEKLNLKQFLNAIKSNMSHYSGSQKTTVQSFLKSPVKAQKSVLALFNGLKKLSTATPFAKINLPANIQVNMTLKNKTILLEAPMDAKPVLDKAVKAIGLILNSNNTAKKKPTAQLKKNTDSATGILSKANDKKKTDDLLMRKQTVPGHKAGNTKNLQPQIRENEAVLKNAVKTGLIKSESAEKPAQKDIRNKQNGAHKFPHVQSDKGTQSNLGLRGNLNQDKKNSGQNKKEIFQIKTVYRAQKASTVFSKADKTHMLSEQKIPAPSDEINEPVTNPTADKDALSKMNKKIAASQLLDRNLSGKTQNSSIAHNHLDDVQKFSVKVSSNEQKVAIKTTRGKTRQLTAMPVDDKEKQAPQKNRSLSGRKSKADKKDNVQISGKHSSKEINLRKATRQVSAKITADKTHPSSPHSDDTLTHDWLNEPSQKQVKSSGKPVSGNQKQSFDVKPPQMNQPSKGVDAAPVIPELKTMSKTRTFKVSLRSMHNLQNVIEQYLKLKPGKYTVNRMRISSSALGELEVQFKDKGAARHMTIVVESDAAKAEVQKLLPAIQHGLMDKGFAFQQINVDLGQAGPRQFKKENERQKSTKHNTTITREENDDNSSTVIKQKKFGYNTVEYVA